MIQALLTGWLAKKLMLLPKWLLMGIGAVLLAKWIRERKKGTD
jgi:uncharacterized membrane protein YeaQ/YmgE (transglycosylase-associated protein family)